MDARPPTGPRAAARPGRARAVSAGLLGSSGRSSASAPGRSTACAGSSTSSPASRPASMPRRCRPLARRPGRASRPRPMPYRHVTVRGTFDHARRNLRPGGHRRRPGLLGADPARHRCRLHRAGRPRLRAGRAARSRDARTPPGGGRHGGYGPFARERARRRLPAPQRPRRRPLVLPRRRRHRGASAASRGRSRPISSMPTRRRTPAAGRSAGSPSCPSPTTTSSMPSPGTRWP